MGEIKKDSHYERRVALAKEYKCYYTGKDQQWILDEYRKNENAEYKAQRKRLTKTHSKHVVAQIENIYDKLRTLDTSAINIKNAPKTKQFMYDNNLEEIAYQFVKYGNLLDANQGIYFYVENDTPVFQVVQSDNIYTMKYQFDKLVYVSTKVGEKTYEYYPNKTVETFNKIETTSEATKRPHFFRVGFKKDVETKLETCVGILEPASELFKNLVCDGSELDVIKALHGIVRTDAYADLCTNKAVRDGKTLTCSNGTLKDDKGTAYEKCGACTKGLKIPTSSQDVHYFQKPFPGQPVQPLGELTKYTTIDQNILDMKRDDLKETANTIIRVVFNSNNVTQKDLVVKTATESKIDYEGVISAIGSMGKVVSEVYMWMGELIADFFEEKEATIFHGFTLDLSEDTLDSLIARRKSAEGLPKHIIEVLDYAILKKQHIDNPDFVDNLNVWTKFMPFSDLTINERTALISTLPDTDKQKQLYLHFQDVKNRIIEEEEKFYKEKYMAQRKIIYNTLEKVLNEI